MDGAAGGARGGPPSGWRPSARRSKLDPYKPMIDELLAAEAWNAVVIRRETAARGTRGREHRADYVRPQRAPRPKRATPTARCAHDVRWLCNRWRSLVTGS